MSNFVKKKNYIDSHPFVCKDRDSWNEVYLGLICPMKSVPEILCFIHLLLMPSTLGVAMVVKKIEICFVKNRR